MPQAVLIVGHFCKYWKVSSPSNTRQGSMCPIEATSGSINLGMPFGGPADAVYDGLSRSQSRLACGLRLATCFQSELGHGLPIPTCPDTECFFWARDDFVGYPSVLCKA
eukprot:7182797-Pyramimonas_sp.AAC.1